MLPRTKRSFKISESSIDETSLRGQRRDPSVKLNRFHRNNFLVFSDAVMIVNLFESFCCHLKCLSLIMALFLYNPWNNVLKSVFPPTDEEMRIFEFILDSFEDVLYLSSPRYLIKSLPLVKMLVFDSGTSGWQPDWLNFRCPTNGGARLPGVLPNGNRKWETTICNPQGNHETLMNRQLSSCLRSLSGGHHHWVRCSSTWQCCDDDAHDSCSWNLQKDATCPWDVNLQGLILLNIDFANILISLICFVSVSLEPPLKEHPFETSAAQTGHVNMRTWMCSHLSQV